MNRDEARERLVRLGLAAADAEVVADHFAEAEQRGKLGHGFSRLPWLEQQPFDFAARPRRLGREGCLERWDGSGALGYVTLAAICDAVLAERPEPVRVVAAANCFPTGALGLYVRRLAESGLVAALTATSPARLAHPEGGAPLAGTNPLAIGIPSTGGEPVVTDVSMGAVTHGEVLAGQARAEDLVPFGGEHGHKAFALALGLQLLVDSLVGDGYGALLVVATPVADPVPALRSAAEGIRLPGSS